MSLNHKGNTQPAIDQEEHTHIGNVAGKKVFIIDDSGNQVTTFGFATVALQPYSFYQQTSLVSGYTYYGIASPGSNPTQSVWRIQRETLDTGEVIYGSGTPQFVHQWSSSSLASISYA